ncbi:MAG TPA: glycerophosphodiester phosphodiesterase [Solirubrobacteraceae bacterium]|nr:glycerophosphodiester phosphodiesterase [Solirubrobacteraceae bacterium]
MSTQRLRRVGHKGADLIAPGNTVESFDAALAAGVDMIEFDVLISQDRERLLLAHDYEDAQRRVPHTLAEGLDHLASDAFAEVELDIDLKLPGYELAVLEALRARGLLKRSLISSMYRSSLALIRANEPDVRLGWSVPKVRRDPFRSRALRLPVLAAMYGMRLILPLQAARGLRARTCDAVMVHWRLVTPRLVRAVRDAGGELYVWTVDDAEQLREFEQMGVTGLITNDPRLFAALPA